MKRLQNKLNHEVMKLFITNKVAFQTASLNGKEQIVVETKNKLESVVLFITIFSSFFLMMMAIRTLIVL
ncbi:MAG: hypothetical protein QNL43_05575 [Crocinitomicaceae bacterium]|jgi:hypothetical protein|tara:strand:+ start:3009 stop:3215 length:207 start_codon:yes stop_codon:yes gene_type:complete